MVKAIKIDQFGGPEVLEFKEIEIPKLNPNEVLVANKSVGLNFIDVYHRTGLYPIPTTKRNWLGSVWNGRKK